MRGKSVSSSNNSNSSCDRRGFYRVNCKINIAII